MYNIYSMLTFCLIKATRPTIIFKLQTEHKNNVLRLCIDATLVNIPAAIFYFFSTHKITCYVSTLFLLLFNIFPLINCISLQLNKLLHNSFIFVQVRHEIAT